MKSPDDCDQSGQQPEQDSVSAETTSPSGPPAAESPVLELVLPDVSGPAKRWDEPEDEISATPEVKSLAAEEEATPSPVRMNGRPDEAPSGCVEPSQGSGGYSVARPIETQAHYPEACPQGNEGVHTEKAAHQLQPVKVKRIRAKKVDRAKEAAAAEQGGNASGLEVPSLAGHGLSVDSHGVASEASEAVSPVVFSSSQALPTPSAEETAKCAELQERVFALTEEVVRYRERAAADHAAAARKASQAAQRADVAEAEVENLSRSLAAVRKELEFARAMGLTAGVRPADPATLAFCTRCGHAVRFVNSWSDFPDNVSKGTVCPTYQLQVSVPTEQLMRLTEERNSWKKMANSVLQEVNDSAAAQLHRETALKRALRESNDERERLQLSFETARSEVTHLRDATSTLRAEVARLQAGPAGQCAQELLQAAGDYRERMLRTSQKTEKELRMRSRQVTEARMKIHATTLARAAERQLLLQSLRQYDASEAVRLEQRLDTLDIDAVEVPVNGLATDMDSDDDDIGVGECVGLERLLDPTELGIVRASLASPLDAG
mmetsp:Transcript_34581/g.83427  ORF Transcript_34581/g.83427 Transcript_34581/m.83427 type:complete len:550 (-) Transcript_34581:109-1758(-)